MQKTVKKGFFGSHAKSSAMVASLIIHIILIAVAISFVTVQVIIKDDNQFETLKVNRPKMPPKKLQVPVKIQKKTQPKLRRKIMVNNQINRKMPEIKMPDMVGIKGGIGSMAVGTESGLGGIGFFLPEINVFGVKSKSEKIFFLLDGGAEMMYDEMGGIPAYTLIKEELLRIVDNLPSTVLFNVAVFQRGTQSRVLFPSLVNASKKNVAALKKWLEPLNAVSADMDDNDYGTKTLGPGGLPIEEVKVEPIESYGFWVGPALLAMKQQADSVYILTSQWGNLYHRLEDRKGSEEALRKWDELYEKGKKKLEQENKQRRKNGQPPRVLKGKMTIIKAYFPDAHPPSRLVQFEYTPKIMSKAMDTVCEEFASSVPTKSGLSGKRPKKYSVNIIHFVPKSGDLDDEKSGVRERSDEQLKQMARLCRGKYRSIAGLEAIQSYIDQGQE